MVLGPPVDAETACSLLEDGIEQADEYAEPLGRTLGATIAGVSPPASIVLGLLGTCFNGLLQQKAVEVGQRTKARVDTLLDDIDDKETRKQLVLAGTLRALSHALPDGEEWDDALTQSAHGDPEALLELLSTYQDDERRRRQFEDAVTSVLRGDAEVTTEESDENVIDHLRTQFGAETRNEALARFLDVQDLLVSREVHETLEQVHGLETNVDAIEQKVEQARSRLDRLLDRDLRNSGFRRIDDVYFRVRPIRGFETAWKTGIEPQEVRAGYAVERTIELDGDRLDPDETVTHLSERTAHGNLVVRGKPGSGKSIFCRDVLSRWHDRGLGDVFYRKSGQPDFDDPGTLIDAVEQTDGHVLVVVEDAARDEVRALYPVLKHFENDRSVTFLLNARYGEWSDFDPALFLEADTTSAYREIKRTIPKASISSLDPAGCRDVIEHFEEYGDTTIDIDGETLFERIQTKSRAGEMLHLVYTLASGGRTGLDDDVRDKFQTIEYPDSERAIVALDGDRELVRHVGLCINLLNAAESIEFRREYVYALSGVLPGEPRISEINDVLDSFDGWLLFDGGTAQRYATVHEFWSFLFLRYLLEGEPRELQGTEDRGVEDDVKSDDPVNAITANERFATCMRAILTLLDGELDRQRSRRIRNRVSDVDETIFADRETDPESTADSIVEALFGIGEEYPILAPLFQPSYCSDLDLGEFDVCSRLTIVRATLARGSMYGNRGELETARMEYERCKELLTDATGEENRRLEAKRLRRLGEVFATESSFDEAKQHLVRSIELFESVSDGVGLAKAHSDLGRVKQLMGEFGNAVLQHARSLKHVPDDNRRERAETINKLGEIAYSRGDPDDAQAYHEWSLNIFRDLDNRRGEAASLNNLGTVAYQRGNFAEAEQYHEQSLDIVRNTGDRRLEAITLGNLGNVAEARGNFAAADRYHGRSLGLFDDIGERRNKGTCFNNLGKVALSRGDLDDAERYFERGLSILQDVEYRQMELICLHNLGKVALSRGDLDDAEQYAERCLTILRDLGDDRMKALCINNLGRVAHERGDLAEAEQYYEQSLGIFRNIGHQHGRGNCLNNLGKVEYEREHLDSARRYYARSLDALWGTGHRQLLGACLGNLGLLAEARGDFEDAEAYYEWSLSIFRDIGANGDALDVFDDLIGLYEEDGRVEDARQCCQQALDIIDSNDASVLKSRRDDFKTRGQKLQPSE